MMSERYFVRAFSSFWRDTMPLIEILVRDINLNLYERVAEPIDSASHPERRALINDLAFEAFSENWNASAGIERLEDSIAMLSVKIFEKVRRFESVDQDTFSMPTQQEMDEALQLARQLHSFTYNHSRDGLKVTTKPRFPGCGLMDECEGDIIIGNTLYEIKSGDRPYRSVDLRQLALYCALASLTSQHTIRSIGLYNPRRGTYYTAELNNFCIRVSGIGPSEMLGRILSCISGLGISK